MNWRTTRLVTREENLVVIPNSELGQATITNLARPIRFSCQIRTIQLDHDVPVNRALTLLRAALLAATRDNDAIATNPQPLARVDSADGSGVVYQIVYYMDFAVASNYAIQHIVMNRILEHLHQAGLRPAVKRQDLFTAPMPDRRVDSKRPDHRRLLLSRVDLFAGLTDDELAALADAMALRRFEEGDCVIRASDPGQSLFVASEGFLRVVGADEREIGTVMPGEFFGEMSLLTGEPRSATVHAATDAVCFEIGTDNLLPLLKSRPDIAERISRAIARRQMRNEQMATASEADREVRTQTFARDILARMRRFFGA
jgi:CRP-like cAMP-binding protein